MDTAWLEVFRAVARQGSFTAAGAELGFTLSAVSRQIAAPEAEFGAPPSTGCHVAYGSPSRAATRSATPGPPSTGSPTPTADAALVPRALAAFAADHPGVHVTSRATAATTSPRWRPAALTWRWCRAIRSSWRRT